MYKLWPARMDPEEVDPSEQAMEPTTRVEDLGLGFRILGLGFRV